MAAMVGDKEDTGIILVWVKECLSRNNYKQHRIRRFRLQAQINTTDLYKFFLLDYWRHYSEVAFESKIRIEFSNPLL